MQSLIGPHCSLPCSMNSSACATTLPCPQVLATDAWTVPLLGACPCCPVPDTIAMQLTHLLPCLQMLDTQQVLEHVEHCLMYPKEHVCKPHTELSPALLQQPCCPGACRC